MNTCFLVVTGSISAITSPTIIRSLQERNFDVHCILTSSGKRFITPESLAAISKNAVLQNEFFAEDTTSKADIPPDFWHIECAKKADVFLVAPATADTIARIAHGRANGIFEASILTTKAPIIVAPAMNSNMLTASATQENINILQKRGIHILPTEKGILACGEVGDGKLLSPEAIALHTKRIVNKNHQNDQQHFQRKKILITLGATEEPVDPVRIISNRSSGKMGISLAKEAFFLGADVHIISGKTDVTLPNIFQYVKHIRTGEEMYIALTQTMEQYAFDIVFFCAAVSDFVPHVYSKKKISLTKEDPHLSLLLKKGKDIAAEIGKNKKKHQKFYGFALQTEKHNAESIARKKMDAKNLDAIILNYAENLEGDTGEAWLITKKNKTKKIIGSKKEIAENIFHSLKIH
jgi:phosphopantothenoylcysteine decarboxylase/phosphopantothenate--cysteine ligase